MIQTYRTSGGKEFSSLALNPIEIYTDDDMDGVYLGNVITALNGEQYTLVDSMNVGGRVYRLTLLPV
jgi:hypothetical protein